MTIINRYFPQMYMLFLTTEKEMFLSSQLQQENIINKITLQVLTFRNTKIFPFQLPIWRCSPNTILLEVIKMMYRQVYCMWLIIMFLLVKNNGHGDMAISDVLGTET